jgi:hypothetical protein
VFGIIGGIAIILELFTRLLMIFKHGRMLLIEWMQVTDVTLRHIVLDSRQVREDRKKCGYGLTPD